MNHHLQLSWMHAISYGKVNGLEMSQNHLNEVVAYFSSKYHNYGFLRT